MSFLHRGFLIVLSIFFGATSYTAEGTRSRVAATHTKFPPRAAKAKYAHRSQVSQPFYLMCKEELPLQRSLVEYTKDWSAMIGIMREPIARGDSFETTIYNGTKISFVRVAHAEFTNFGLQKQRETVHFILTKNVGRRTVQFSDYCKKFVAQELALQSIGTFLDSTITASITDISLEHNELTSFEEIQNKIVAVCPSLKRLNLNHNKLVGTLWMEHKNICSFSAAYNNFSSLGKITLPQAELVDLSYNNIGFNNTPDADVSDICYFNIKGNPNIEVESLSFFEGAAMSQKFSNTRSHKEFEAQMQELHNTDSSDEGKMEIGSDLELDGDEWIDNL